MSTGGVGADLVVFILASICDLAMDRFHLTLLPRPLGNSELWFKITVEAAAHDLRSV